jgi:EpsI family protein
LLAGLVVAFGHNFYEMWFRWFPAWRLDHLSLYDRLIGGESYYTHAPLVPLISLVIAILLIRHTRIPVRPNRLLGIAVLVGSLVFHLVSCQARVNFASGFAFIGVLAGLVLLLWGTTALRRFAFPLGLLFFMVPLPEVTIYDLNFRLKFLAADWGVWLANAVGSLLGAVGIDELVAEQSGNKVVVYPDKQLVVANVCNGLRTLISLIAFGALYAFVCKLRGAWRLGLFLMSVPVAVLSNTARIASLIVVAHLWDVDTATGAYHDISGLIVYGIAFLLMFGIEKAVLSIRQAVGKPATIQPLFHDVRREEDDPDPWTELNRAFDIRRLVPAAALVALTAVAVVHINREKPATWKAATVARMLPEEMTVDGVEFVSYGVPVSRVDLLVLETQDYFYRKYIDYTGGDRSVDFFVIYSKDNRKGTHPPDVCIEGGGNQIFSKRDIEVTTADGRRVPCRELLVRRQVPGMRGEVVFCFLYTYKCGDTFTRSFWWQQFVIFRNGLLNRDASGALVRVSTRIAGPGDKALAEGRRWTRRFVAAGVPYLEALGDSERPKGPKGIGHEEAYRTDRYRSVRRQPHRGGRGDYGSPKLGAAASEAGPVEPRTDP